MIKERRMQTGRCSMAWLLLNRPDEAQNQLTLATQTLGDGFHLPHVQAAIAQVNIDLYVGAAAVASQRLLDAWPTIEQTGVMRLQQPRVELNLLRGRTLLADTAQSDRLRAARALGDEMLKEGAGWAAALGHLVRAAVFVWSRDDDATIAELVRAEEELTAAGMIGHLHVARLRRGTLEGGGGGLARAEAARDMLRDLGATDPDRLAAHMLPWPA